ncbi:MAG: hypothetical protein IT347_02380 [Candidatus Eisenbacteria bacterium]|nr:hypothetical protein [Candidatus Eisenbacteria bacterium]
MKKSFVLFVALAVAGTLAAAGARAQAFGQYSGATTLGMNTRLFGAYGSFTRSESELLAQLRLSFYPNVDFGFQGGLSRVSVLDRSRTSIKVGGDFKGMVVHRGDAAPFDLSLGAALGVSSAEDFNLLSIGPQAVASRTFGSPGRANVTPYVGALLLFTRSDLNNANDTDVSVPLRFGAEYAPNPDIRLVLELGVAVSDRINDDLKLTVGANFPF